jgi:hypothetical protein
MGDSTFNELADTIEQVVGLFSQLESSPPEEKPESIKKWLDHLGDSMYVCTMGFKKVAISKSLLAYLEYDAEEFAIEAIKYRAIFTEYCL